MTHPHQTTKDERLLDPLLDEKVRPAASTLEHHCGVKAVDAGARCGGPSIETRRFQAALPPLSLYFTLFTDPCTLILWEESHYERFTLIFYFLYLDSWETVRHALQFLPVIECRIGSNPGPQRPNPTLDVVRLLLLRYPLFLATGHNRYNCDVLKLVPARTPSLIFPGILQRTAPVCKVEQDD